jgi:riboflavin kinase/FMN adenylyltransferase
MYQINRLEDIKAPFRRGVITIGNFDGVHIGHQALFHEVIEKAEAIDGTSIAMTFEPHPLRVLGADHHPPLITVYPHKVELIQATGIDVLITIPFTREFAAVSASQFVQDLLVKKIGMTAIVVGKDYAFGRNREGDLTLLQRLAGTMGFELILSNWIRPNGDPAKRISSTHIRQRVMDGQMAVAAKMLGRPYQIRGTVSRGRDRGGRLLGFPTANIILQDELCPKSGVYAVTVQRRQQIHNGVANIGYSPTFDDNQFTIEVHILDFNDSIYDETIRVNFMERLRDEIKFNGIDELSRQIRQDIETARRVLPPTA